MKRIKWWMRRVISKNQIADIYIKYFRDKWNVKCEFYRFFIMEMNNEELKFLPFFLHKVLFGLSLGLNEM
jgi:hypothetical protein